ncbi:chaperone modulator CbpM [Rhizobium sp. RAF56]|jgi:chaperone modulatory protein CbpM|uniref:chaperone modulator CbpM n=1 Tax=Rhizobium sp. RAF56 TaxID=3233062 RepID=UPI003F9C7112
MNEIEFRRSLKIDVTVLEVWIEQGWVVPDASLKERHFRDADLARARLILDLSERMGVNEAGVDVVMDLVDQLHGLRGTLRELIAAIHGQDADVKRRILALCDTDREDE